MSETGAVPEVEITGRGARRAVVLTCIVCVSVFVVAAIQGAVIIQLLTPVVVCLFVTWQHLGDRVVLRQDALVARTRAGERVYPWPDVLEMSWWGGRWWHLGGGPVLRVRGGPWDVPGPNAAALVAMVPLFSRGAGQAAARAVRAAAELHGVPWSMASATTTPPRPRTSAGPEPRRSATPPVAPVQQPSADGALPPSPFTTRRSRQAAQDERVDDV